MIRTLVCLVGQVKTQIARFPLAKGMGAGLVLLASECAFAFPLDYGAYGPSEYQKALDQASKEDKKMLIYFRMNNCPPCSYVSGALDSSEVRAAYKNKYVFIEAWVKGGEGSALGRRFGITGAPHFVVLDSKGKPLCKSIGGFANSAEAIELANKMAKLDTWPFWSEPVATSPSPKCLAVIRQSEAR